MQFYLLSTNIIHIHMFIIKLVSSSAAGAGADDGAGADADTGAPPTSRPRYQNPVLQDLFGDSMHKTWLKIITWTIVHIKQYADL